MNNLFRALAWWKLLFRAGLALLAFAAWNPSARANPVGWTVVSGSASACANGSHLSLTVSEDAVLDWQRFDLAPGDLTTIQQPSAASVVWISIRDADISRVYGTLNANGHVVLLHQSGFYFGPNSAVHASSLSIASLSLTDSLASVCAGEAGGGAFSDATIVTYGQMLADPGGSVILVAGHIENHGLISAPGGVIRLGGGKDTLLPPPPGEDSRSSSVQWPAGSIENTGQFIADAGTVSLHAHVVGQNGVIQANSARERHGVIELLASESLSLGSVSVLQANGGGDAPSGGGSITIKSGQNFSDQTGSQIDVSGGANGGNGGSVEISAVNFAGFCSHLNGTAQPGWQGGTLLLDPYDITLVTDNTSDPNPTNLRLNVLTAFNNFWQIRLQATHNILLGYLRSSGTISDTSWNLNTATGISAAGSLLRMEAGNDIVSSGNSHLIAGAGWTVQLAAGVNFSAFNRADFSLAGDFLEVPLLTGIGGIYLGSGNGSIETAEGDLNLRAGHEVLVGLRAGHDVLEPLPAGKDMLEGYGFIRTVGGGKISVTTLDGDVDSGKKDDGYVFSRYGSYIGSPGLGGIGTANGGNVSIDAGRDIMALHAPIGAFGTGSFGQSLAPGDVSLAAGRDIKGHFMLRDGVGTMRAGRDVGDFNSSATLGLVSGNWDVMAGYDATIGGIAPGQGDIYLNEVYNPNGALNGVARVRFHFDYASDASVSLKAGNSVQLLGDSLAHTADNDGRPAIYPGRLEIEAGAGGVVLGNDLVLYPSTSPTAGLSIHTADGGALQSQASGFYQLIVSESGSPDYTTFMDGHAAVPLHLNSLAASVTLDLSGNLENLFVRSPSHADMVVWGHVLNFSFEGQNLSPDDGKDNALRNPFAGTPGGDAGRNYSGIWIKGDYSNSQDIPSSSLARNGLAIGGPGHFEVAAHTLDLGESQGIRSVGPFFNTGLFKVNPNIYQHGADLDVILSGDLTMGSSQIASLFGGGNVNVTALQGRMDVGSTERFVSDDTAVGIYSVHGGNVTVEAGQDILVNGSRIATYDGGNLTVTSFGGDVDAGLGGTIPFYVPNLKVNPSTGGLDMAMPLALFGNGILALTQAGSTSRVGDIYVQAGRDILAGCGGSLLQLPSNGSCPPDARIYGRAGHNIRVAEIIACNIELDAYGTIELDLCPSMALQPSSQSVAAGENATFTLLPAIPWPDLTYQWQKDGVPIPGATASSLTLPSVSRRDAGAYSVAVSNSFGGVISQEAVLHVRVPQRFIAPEVLPSGKVRLWFADDGGGVLTAGDAASFMVEASTNLVDWTALPNSVALDPSGLLYTDDLIPEDAPMRFYRVISR